MANLLEHIREVQGQLKPEQVRHHPKSPHASLERFSQLAGSIALKGPVPSWKFLEDEEELDERAGD